MQRVGVRRTFSWIVSAAAATLLQAGRAADAENIS